MEDILVIERAKILNFLVPEGILKISLNKFLKKAEKYGFYKNRDLVENDANLKQIIPYLLLKKGKMVFVYKRMPGGGEKRLHNLISIGVGGHMRKMAENVEENLFKNLERELKEEMVLKTKYDIKFLGILNEDFTPVCQVHLGLIFLIEPEEPKKVYVKEKRELEGKWFFEEEIESFFNEMEVWSKILWRYIRREK